jgi:tRNA (guanine-N7-)-methyltransferase
VIEHYGGKMVRDYNDVYQQAVEPELLNIKTHYEGLDIAQSGKIFYLCLSLPEQLNPELDASFAEKIRAREFTKL